MNEKLAHLRRKIHRALERAVRNSGTIAKSLYDQRPADVPIRHHFELKTEEPIYCKGRRVSPKHNRVIWEELQKMLKAGIIIPTTSEWTSPAVVATKKDGNPRFCVDYRLINRLMKGGRWPIPRIQEIFDDLVGARVFTTLDLLTGYWQIKLSER